MNFKKAFTYIFEDQRWFEKLIVPLLVTLIPVVGGMANSRLYHASHAQRSSKPGGTPAAI